MLCLLGVSVNMILGIVNFLIGVNSGKMHLTLRNANATSVAIYTCKSSNCNSA